MKVGMVDLSKGWGGAERIVLSLAEGLRGRGHNVVLFLRRGADTVDRFTAAGFDVFAVERGGLGNLTGLVEMATAVRRMKCDLVHVHRNHDLLCGKTACLVSGGLPLVLTQHCRLGRASSVTMDLPDRIVAVSEFIAEGIRSRFPRIKGKISVVHNGIDLDRFRVPGSDFWTTRTDFPLGKGSLLGVVGFFYKNQEELIRLLPSLLSRYPDLLLVIIGHDKSRMDGMQKVVAECGVGDSVFFAGEIDYHDMPHALAGLDLNVSVFREEGFGLSVIEGMAVGTPFVGYNSGGYPEIVADQIDGRLVNTGEDLISAISDLLDNRGKLDKMRNRAMEKAFCNFSSESMLHAYEAIYKSTARGMSRRTGTHNA
jgi:glycosyltransferase involved in cell wall biosynthesis